MELCAAYHVYGLIEWMVREAGSHKVIYGTDYPWFDPMVVVGCVTYAHISEEDMTNILYNNAKSIMDPVLSRTGGQSPGMVT
jgi:predicted TIM-barrel fold metal-dependent hydrolase